MTPSSAPSRRDFVTLGTLATAGFGMVQDALAAENNPGVTVADRSSSIRITDFKMWWINPVVFIRIDTNHGVSGWGEIKAIDPRVGMALMTSLFELLKDENPTRIEHLWQKLYRAHRDIRGGAFMTHVIAGIDIALWDLAGKLWGVPVYRLLGGPVRDRIRVYHTPKAQKVPPHGIYEHSGTPADIERMVKAIAAAREKVSRRRGDVRCPQCGAARDAHSIGRRAEALRRAVYRGAGRARQHRGFQTP